MDDGNDDYDVPYDDGGRLDEVFTNLTVLS